MLNFTLLQHCANDLTQRRTKILRLGLLSLQCHSVAFTVEKILFQIPKTNQIKDGKNYLRTYIFCQPNLKTNLKMSNKKSARPNADNSISCI